MIKQLLPVILMLASLLMGVAPRPDAGYASVAELIIAVNALRIANGLEPYVEDGGLNSYAQKQSDYMASLGTWTHQRPDGSFPWDSGIEENVAYGPGLTPQDAIYTYWTDAIHWKTLVGYPGGSVGAGVTEDDGNTYFVLDVRPAGETRPTPGGAKAPVGTPQPTVPSMQEVVTATPMPNGSVIHEVGYGQSLWSIAIAYGTKILEILRLNGLPDTTKTVYVGQKLLIFTALPATVTPAVTETPTVTLTRNTATSLTSRTTPAGKIAVVLPSKTRPSPVQISPTPTPAAFSTPPAALPAPAPSRQTIGVVIIAVCALGLLLVGLSFFRK